MCPMCMTTIVATVVGLGSSGSITAFVATKLRSSIREQDPPKTGDIHINQEPATSSHLESTPEY
jgi:hypothetical protein